MCECTCMRRRDDGNTILCHRCGNRYHRVGHAGVGGCGSGHGELIRDAGLVWVWVWYVVVLGMVHANRSRPVRKLLCSFPAATTTTSTATASSAVGCGWQEAGAAHSRCSGGSYGGNGAASRAGVWSCHGSGVHAVLGVLWVRHAARSMW